MPLPETAAEQLKYINDKKEAGNAHFKAGELSNAAQEYQYAGLYLRSLLMDRSAYAGMNPGTVLPLTSEEKAAAEQLVAAVHNNLAAVHMQQGKHEKVVEDCKKVLEVAPDNAKALFRRGKAYLAMGRVGDAGGDLHRAEKLMPPNKLLSKALAALKTKEALERKKEKQRYKSMFQ